MAEANIIIIDGGLFQRCFLVSMGENDSTVLNYILNSSSMTELVVTNAGMTSHHLRAILKDEDAVMKMKRLQRLDLSGNYLNEDDIRDIKDLVLKKCRKLKTFEFSGQRVLG
ncbi:hypothetical protein BGX28_003792 [Mortierella sp. GBA30]|nr:hypothetical protein BGX28_003792 [Mortierella sp. GBA30]